MSLGSGSNPCRSLLINVSEVCSLAKSLLLRALAESLSLLSVCHSVEFGVGLKLLGGNPISCHSIEPLDDAATEEHDCEEEADERGKDKDGNVTKGTQPTLIVNLFLEMEFSFGLMRGGDGLQTKNVVSATYNM
jgi:hypothetical protein